LGTCASNWEDLASGRGSELLALLVWERLEFFLPDMCFPPISGLGRFAVYLTFTPPTRIVACLQSAIGIKPHLM
jgi:hypothetical protein